MRQRNKADGIDLRAKHRAVLLDRAARPWARGHYDRAIARLDAGEMLTAVPAWELRAMGVSLPHGPHHCYDLHPDGSITPAVIDRSGA